MYAKTVIPDLYNAEKAARPYFYAKNRAMISIPDTLYARIASQLALRICATDYFNGRIEDQTEEAASTLTATLIVYRSAEGVIDIVPVWWEFSMHQPAGEVLTDFSWKEFKAYLMELC